MAPTVDSKGIVQDLVDGQAYGDEGRDNFRRLSALAIASFAIDYRTTVGLLLGYFGGRVFDDPDFILIADGTILLTDNTTNYVERTALGVVSVNQVAFSSGRVPLGRAVTLGGVITLWVDERPLGAGGVGPEGPAGADGLDGAAGADGQDGAPGTDGLNGAAGADGADGLDGAAGLGLPDPTTGTPGQVAVINATSDGYELADQGGGGSSAPTEPAAGYAIWGKADGTLTKDGSDRVTAFGEVGGALVQFQYDGTIGHAPVWTAGGFNGLPFLRFVAASLQSLKAVLAAQYNGKPFTCFVVSHRRGFEATNRLLGLPTGAGADYNAAGGFMMYEDNTWTGIFRGGAFQVKRSTMGIGVPTIESFFQDALAQRYRVNGWDNGYTPTDLSLDNFWLACRAQNGSVADVFNTVDIYEVIIYLSALTFAEFADTERYLMAKYKIGTSYA